MIEKFSKTLKNSNIWKNSVLILATGSILVSFGWFVWSSWLRPSVVTVEVVQGEISVIQGLKTSKISTGLSANFFSGDLLQIPKDSEILLVFSNGQNVALKGEKELLLSSSSKFGSDQLFVFQDQIDGKNFSYSIKFGLDKANAAVIANENKLTPNVLGAMETTNNDQLKFQKLDSLHNCMLEQKSLAVREFDYTLSLESCLVKNQLESLENLK